MVDDNQLVFVYGTLRKGGRLHAHLWGAPLVDTARVEGQLFNVSHGGFPVARKGEGWITGEVYEIGKARLAMLDVIEGHPSWYKRDKVVCLRELQLAPFDAWIYWGTNVPVGERIASGDWLAAQAEAE